MEIMRMTRLLIVAIFLLAIKGSVALACEACCLNHKHSETPVDSCMYCQCLSASREISHNVYRPQAKKHFGTSVPDGFTLFDIELPCQGFLI